MNRRQFIVSTATAAVPLFAGCTLLRDNRQYRFPDKIKATCQSRFNAARDKIASVDGKRPGLKHKVSVRTIKGQKFIGGCWCWKYGNYWVGGLAFPASSGTAIEIGADPTTGAVHPLVLEHEFAHAIIWEVHRTTAHLAKYARLFTGWRDVRLGAWQTLVGESGGPVDVYIVAEA